MTNLVKGPALVSNKVFLPMMGVEPVMNIQKIENEKKILFYCRNARKRAE